MASTLPSPWVKDHRNRSLPPEREAVRVDVVYLGADGEVIKRITLRQMLIVAFKPYRKMYKFDKEMTDLDTLVGAGKLTPDMFDGASRFELVGCDMEEELKKQSESFETSIPEKDREGILSRAKNRRKNQKQQSK